MLNKSVSLALLIVLSVSMTACSGNRKAKPAAVTKKAEVPIVYEKRSPKTRKAKPRNQSMVQRGSFANKLSNAALGRLRSRVRYDGSYVKIGYPWGDVPQNIGVCTDVVIRSYRKLGIDLQQQVHQDMSSAFSTYPNPRKWGLSRPDANIDHRRVYNLRQFFARRGAALPITRNPRDYRPGDLVTWMVGQDLPHIGVVVNKRSRTDPNRYMIVHNIARGPEIEDVLFRFPISGHYRYTTAHVGNAASVRNIASARKSTSRTDAMNYSRLVEAARVLNGVPSSKATTTTPDAKTSETPMQLANLSSLELQEILKK